MYIYAYIDAKTDLPVYIGKTQDIEKRYKQHKNDLWFISNDGEYKYVFQYHEVESNAMADIYETYYISICEGNNISLFNKAKTDWGAISFKLPNLCNWKTAFTHLYSSEKFFLTEYVETHVKDILSSFSFESRNQDWDYESRKNMMISQIDKLHELFPFIQLAETVSPFNIIIERIMRNEKVH